MEPAKKIFEPENTVELLRGWLLHAHKGRDRHDEAARTYEVRRYLIGGFAIGLSAIAGTAAFASLIDSTEIAGRVFAGLVGVAAAVLAALQTFLDYGGRAERHRSTAVKYKSVIRELERVLIGGAVQKASDDPWFNGLQGRLNALEADGPVVAPAIYNRVEQRFQSVTRVTRALDLPSGADKQNSPNNPLQRPDAATSASGSS